MNYRLLSKLFGAILFLIAAAMGLCFIFAIIEQTQGVRPHAAIPMGISTLVTAGVGAFLTYLGKGSGVLILRKEAMVLVGGGWFLAGLFGSIPYLLCEPYLSPAKAIFESFSGFTTTGSTVIGSLSVYPHSILLWRSLTQWLGGLGILVLFVAVLSFLGVGGKTVVRNESSLNLGDSSVHARIRDTAVRLWLIYITFTVTCAVGLWLIGFVQAQVTVTWFDAVCHALTTISTGGFSPHDTSISYFDSLAIELFLAVFMVLSSFNFFLYIAISARRWTRLRVEEEAKLYLVICMGAIIFISLDLYFRDVHGSLVASMRHSFFMIISLASSTGFGTSDYDQWPLFSRVILFALMFMGGCAGSTAGGVKVNRILLFFKTTTQELIKTYRPSQIFKTKINGQRVEAAAKLQTMFFIALMCIIIAGSTLIVCLIEPTLNDVESAAGAVFTSLFNTGPGFGSLGPTDNFAHLHSRTLLFLSFLMVLGRLELFAVLVLFMPFLWRRY